MTAAHGTWKSGPNGTEGDNYDRDAMDFLGEPTDLRAWRNGDARAASPPIKLLSYAEMVNLPAGEWRVHSIIPDRAKSVLFGQSNSFKSFIAVDLGCSVSTGKSFHGLATCKCKVIYVANEGANGVGRKRIPAWMAYHNIAAVDRNNIFLVTVETILPNETSRNKLLAAIRTIVEPGEDFFLIIDVLRGSMTGSENDDEAANAWTSAAEILITEGATLLTVTHSPYAEDGRMRGHSHLWGSFDTRLQAVGDKEKRTTVLKIERHKDHDLSGEWGFQLDEIAIEEHPGETSLVPRIDGEVKSAKKDKNATKPVDIVIRQYLETYDRLADGVTESLGLDFKKVRKVSADAIREELKSRGILETNGKEGLTSSARSLLCRAKLSLINPKTLIEKDELIWRP